eukprot:GHVU01156879.1.p4 GENE.GHVU01156879.1~~GHVU01156879.1.p4  ORF type:complete len:106 (+),score=8.48 GHVU01156879.1:2138-2455(+)
MTTLLAASPSVDYSFICANGCLGFNFCLISVFPPPSRAVYADGRICLDILQNSWSPAMDVAAILTSIQVRPSSPLLLPQDRQTDRQTRKRIAAAVGAPATHSPTL